MSLAWWRPPALLRVVIVNLIAEKDTALRGVLWTSRGPWLVLREATFHRPDGDPKGEVIDGEAIVHRSNVSFVQVLP